MSGTWGNKIKYTIFGESHGEGIGIVIDQLPPGIALDIVQISEEMQRRRPGSSSVSTPRRETDAFEILSGFFMGKTTGAPLCAFIKNTNQQSRDYEAAKNLLRPGHSDFTAHIKYKGFHDYRGGGHHSGRLTAALVFAGAVAKQYLAIKGIKFASHIYQIGTLRDISFLDADLFDPSIEQLYRMSLPALMPDLSQAFEQEILTAKAQGDSIGGVVETAVLNLPSGLGSPFFDSIESMIAHLVFSIPGVKGIEFGAGFSLAEMRGSAANDEFYTSKGNIVTDTNHSGGILGGITSGMPVIFKAAFKPTPSIALEQNTVDILTCENTSIRIHGRHDPCIVPRALPVVEAAAAMAIFDCLITA